MKNDHRNCALFITHTCGVLFRLRLAHASTRYIALASTLHLLVQFPRCLQPLLRVYYAERSTIVRGSRMGSTWASRVQWKRFVLLLYCRYKAFPNLFPRPKRSLIQAAAAMSVKKDYVTRPSSKASMLFSKYTDTKSMECTNSVAGLRQ